MKMYSFGQNIGLLPLVLIVSKTLPMSQRTEANPLITYQVIDENVQFLPKHRLIKGYF